MSSALTVIEDHVFTDCGALTGTVTIPEGVISIGIEAFYGCNSITRVLLPESLTEIRTGAFDGCSHLTGTLSIPNAVTFIDEMAFNGCRRLTGIRLGNSLTRIGYATFCGCRSIVRLDTDLDYLATRFDISWRRCFHPMLSTPWRHLLCHHTPRTGQLCL